MFYVFGNTNDIDNRVGIQAGDKTTVWGSRLVAKQWIWFQADDKATDWISRLVMKQQIGDPGWWQNI